MTDQFNKVCVVLGAGAAYDVWNGSTRIRSGEWRPPLARELFDIAAKPQYEQILKDYPGAAFLAGDLSPRVASGEIAIEKALGSYATHSDARIRDAFKHIPAYLRDLLFKASVSYVPRPGTYIQLVVRLMADCPHEVLFIVLNYDDFLERALSQFDPIYTFTSIDEYIVQGRQATVVKPHGSIDWFTPMAQANGAWEEQALGFDIFSKPPEYIVISSHSSSVRTINHRDRHVYPLITAPIADKSAEEFVCPDGHISHAREFLKTCRKFLVIGTSGLDDDLLNLLNTSVDAASRPHLQFVGMNDIAQVAERFYKGVEAFGRMDKTVNDKPRTYSTGLREFMLSEEFQEFAKF